MRCGVVVRKLGMSRIFDDSGNHVPVTILRLEDVEVLSAKSIEKDGYCAMQIGFGNKKPKNITKPLRGFFAKAKSEPKEKVVEFRVSEDAVLKIGDKIGVNHFVAGQKVDLVGVSQGKGFAGSMKRHNFGGSSAVLPICKPEISDSPSSFITWSSLSTFFVSLEVTISKKLLNFSNSCFSCVNPSETLNSDEFATANKLSKSV